MSACAKLPPELWEYIVILGGRYATCGKLMLAGVRPLGDAQRQLRIKRRLTKCETEMFSLENVTITKWRLDGRLHRDDDFPAEVWTNGHNYWDQYGQLHRDGDQPAAMRADGTRIWYRYGLRHRDGDKPAEIWDDGTQRWFLYGSLYKTVH